MEVTITKDNFETEVLQSEKTVLLDFWAPWCYPCRMLAPTIEEVAAERPALKVGKVNIDDEPALAQEFGIMSIPTIIVFQNGRKVNEAVGNMPKEEIEALLA